MVYKYHKDIPRRLYFIHPNKDNLTLISNYDKFYSNLPFNEIKGLVITRHKINSSDLIFPKSQYSEIIEKYSCEDEIFTEIDQDVFFTYFSKLNFSNLHTLPLEKKEESKLKLNSLEGMLKIPKDSKDKDFIIEKIISREYVKTKMTHEYVLFDNFFKRKADY